MNWLIYNTSNSGLPDDFVTAIKIDSQSNKWIGTMDDFFSGDLTIYRDGGVVVKIHKYPLELPIALHLHRNYPNPSTTIAYDIPKPRMYALIFTTSSEKIRMLVNENKTACSYKVVWDGHTDSGQSAPSGVYFYVLTTPEFKQSRKMLLIR